MILEITFLYSILTLAVAAPTFGRVHHGVVSAELMQLERTDFEKTLMVSAYANYTNFTTVSESIGNKLTYYAMNISVGTPAQHFLVQVDTGSSDLWVPGNAIKFDGYNKEQSSTFKHVSDNFFIRYVKDFARGFWGTESVGFPSSNVVLQNQQFGVATHAPEVNVGILGVGPIAAEACEKKYSNVPQSLVDQGIISKNAYSIYMGDHLSKRGKILFGGKDRAKFNDLSVIPILSNSSITVAMSSLRVGEQFILNNTLEVLLDTGTSLVYLPEKDVNRIAKIFGARMNPSLSMYVVKQDVVNNIDIDGISMEFGNTTIKMSKSELFWPLSWFTLEAGPFYVMTLLPNTQSLGFNILGDSFLRSAYTLYDLDAREVHIGQYVASPHSDVIAI